MLPFYKKNSSPLKGCAPENKWNKNQLAFFPLVKSMPFGRAPAVPSAFPQQGVLPRDQAHPVPAPLTLWCSHQPPPPPEGQYPSACPGALAQHQCAVNPCTGNAGRDRGLQRGVLRPQSKGLSCPPVAQTT